MQLTALQRDALKAVAGDGIHCINHQVFRLRTENPQAFHSDESLCGRIFVHAPLHGEPCLAFLRQRYRNMCDETGQAQDADCRRP